MDTFQSSLHPEHLKDLRKSGLTDVTIQAAGVYSVPPRGISKMLEGHFPNVKSLLSFPYPGTDGYERFKLFPPQVTDKGTVKYYQKAGSPSRLYFPPGIEPLLQEASIPLYITEGEKKCLKAYQEGIPCIALGGLWNWSDGAPDKNLIPDFDRINLKGRTAYLAPDNDYLKPDRHGEPKNLRQAVYELGYRLIERGVRVFVVELPQGPQKIGLDDYLYQYTVEKFQTLPTKEIRKLTIGKMIEGATVDVLPEILERLARELMESQREPYITMIKEKLGIPKAQLRNDIERIFWRQEAEKNREEQKKAKVDIDRLLESGTNPEPKFSAQNFVEGVLSFGAIIGGQLVLVRSDKKIVDEDKGDSFRFKRSTLTVEAIKRFRAEEDVDGNDLLDRIRTLFADHLIFKDERIPLLLAIWTIGTYMFKVFRYYGYIWVNSPLKRCAKSRVLNILSPLCFNSTKRLVNPSPASVFREIDCDDKTLIIDEVESLGSTDKDQKSELIGLLNAGFERDGQAPRMEKKNGNFVPTYFNVYSPKALAGIKSIVDTIEDRSFKILMVRKKKSEKVKRFNLRALDSHIKKIQEDCFIWALKYAEDVSEVYDEVAEFPGTKSLDDRMKDILEPLLSIASVIDAQAGETQMVKALIALAQDLGKSREDSEPLSMSILAIVNLVST